MLKFRFMEENDLNEANKIYEACFAKEILDRKRKATYRDNVLLAILDEKIVGMLTIDYMDDNFLNEKTAHINNVCVMPEYQNMGIAYKMMIECEKICKKNSVQVMKLTSNKNRRAAHKVYNKCAFEIYDTVVFKKNI